MTKLCEQNEEILEGYKFRADRGCLKSGSHHRGHTGCTSACSTSSSPSWDRCTACSGPGRWGILGRLHTDRYLGGASLQLFAFSRRHCAELEVDMWSVRLPVRKWTCRLCTLSYTVPHRRRALRTPSTQLPHGFSIFRATSGRFLICSASPRDVVKCLGTFLNAFAKFQDTVHGKEAFGTTRVRFRRFPERADVVTMSGRQHGQDAKGVRKFISASKFCSRPTFRRGNFLMSGTCGNTRKGLATIKTVCWGY